MADWFVFRRGAAIPVDDTEPPTGPTPIRPEDIPALPVSVLQMMAMAQPYKIMVGLGLDPTTQISYMVKAVQINSYQTGARPYINDVADPSSFEIEHNILQPYWVLAKAVSRTDRLFEIEGRIEDIDLPDYFIVGEEIIALFSSTYTDRNTTVFHASRGMMDTVPTSHNQHTILWERPFFSRTLYPAITLGVQLVTYTALHELPLTNAPTKYIIGARNRAQSPYPPAAITIYGNDDPPEAAATQFIPPAAIRGDIGITYFGRNKLTDAEDTGVGLDWFAQTEIDPESGTNVVVKIYSIFNGVYSSLFVHRTAMLRAGNIQIKSFDLFKEFRFLAANLVVSIGSEKGSQSSFQAAQYEFQWHAEGIYILRFNGVPLSDREILQFEDISPDAKKPPRVKLRFELPGEVPIIPAELRFVNLSMVTPLSREMLRFQHLDASEGERCGQPEIAYTRLLPSGEASGAALAIVERSVYLHIIIGGNIRRFSVSVDAPPTIDPSWSKPVSGKYLDWYERTQHFIVVNPTPSAPLHNVEYYDYSGGHRSTLGWELHANNADPVAMKIRGDKCYVWDKTDKHMYVYSLLTDSRGNRLTADEFTPNIANIETMATDGVFWWLFDDSRKVYNIPWGGGARNVFREFDLKAGTQPRGVVIWNGEFLVVDRGT